MWTVELSAKQSSVIAQRHDQVSWVGRGAVVLTQLSEVFILRNPKGFASNVERGEEGNTRFN
jgi:hypothetical protein